MFMIAEFKDNKIVWNDGKVLDNKIKAQNRLDFVKKHSKRTNLQIIRFTQFKLFNPAS